MRLDQLLRICNSFVSSEGVLGSLAFVVVSGFGLPMEVSSQFLCIAGLVELSLGKACSGPSVSLEIGTLPMLVSFIFEQDFCMISEL